VTKAVAAFCCIAMTACSETAPNHGGTIEAVYDESFMNFAGWVAQDDGRRDYIVDRGAVRFQYSDGRPVPFSNENEQAVRRALIAFCAETTGINDFDEFSFVRNEMIGLCYDATPTEQ